MWYTLFCDVVVIQRLLSGKKIAWALLLDPSVIIRVLVWRDNSCNLDIWRQVALEIFFFLYQCSNDFSRFSTAPSFEVCLTHNNSRDYDIGGFLNRYWGAFSLAGSTTKNITLTYTISQVNHLYILNDEESLVLLHIPDLKLCECLPRTRSQTDN